MEPITPAPPFHIRFAPMRQTWNDLTFLHWRYEPAAIRKLVPPELSIDVLDGSAWVGLVPFLITGLTAPVLPSIPWISRFPETNIRTYVTDGQGRRGVWFFSLDAARLAAVAAARAAYGLPYFWARMRVRRNGSVVEYRSRRLLRPGYSDLAIQVDDTVAQPSELELSLTARFRLFTRWMRRPVFARVEHPEWPLRRARVIRLEETLLRATGLPNARGEPLVHFAERVDVRTASCSHNRPGGTLISQWLTVCSATRDPDRTAALRCVLCAVATSSPPRTRTRAAATPLPY